MNIYLIRHGLTTPGEEGRYQGFLDESLSKKGRDELIAAAQKPPRVYVSPAKRARETAGILFPETRQICIPGLWEMNFGVFEGRTWKEMENDAQYREWVDGMCLGKCPGGESRASFSERVCSAFLDVLDMEKKHRQSGKNNEDEDLFIVSHGGTQMAILEQWGRPARDYYSWQRPCGCGWVLQLKESEYTEAAQREAHSNTHCGIELQPKTSSPVADALYGAHSNTHSGIELQVLKEVSFVRKNE